MIQMSQLYTFQSINKIRTNLQWVEQLRYECQLNWLFIRRDLLVSIVPGLLFSTTALINHPAQNFGELITILTKGSIYFWLCITTFCISSQLVGMEEDRLNKPDRPLITGFVTPEAARLRWYIASIGLTLLGWWTGTLGWALTWQIGCLIYDYAGGSQHWYGKTLLGGIGVTSEIGAAWQLVEPAMDAIVWRWIGLIGLYLITLMAVQDFRDVAGDQAQGRLTMPIVFGEMPSRYVIAAGYMGFPLLIHYGLMAPAGLSLTIIAWDIFLAGFSWTIGYRTLFLRTAKQDHGTYVGFTVLLCAYLASSIAILRV